MHLVLEQALEREIQYRFRGARGAGTGKWGLGDLGGTPACLPAPPDGVGQALEGSWRDKSCMESRS